MLEIPYTKSRLLKCFQRKDYLTGKLKNLANEKENIIHNSYEGIENENIFFNSLERISIQKKPAYKFKSIHAEIAARLISKNLKINYRTKQADRNTIILNIKNYLEEGTPFQIHRLDVKSFYENIDRKDLFEKLVSEKKTSWQTLKLIEHLFLNFDHHDIVGLPRGLSLSATLSEIYMRDFDNAVSNIQDIFFYSRFVDDILILSLEDTSNTNLLSTLNELKPISIDFHTEGKSKTVNVPKIKKESQSINPTNLFEYLGYKFTLHGQYDEKKDSFKEKRKVTIDISEEKIDKIKKRLIQSFASYLATPKNHSDYSILKNRIMFLTGNYTIKDPKTNITIKTGIYFNYLHKNQLQTCALKRLDIFYRSLLFSSTSSLSKRIKNNISLKNRRDLAGYSFEAGFFNVRYHSFSYKQLNQIKERWD